MDSILKSDIFFFISAIAVVIITICIAIALGYLIYLLNTAKYIMKKIKTQSELLESDFTDLRDYLKNQGTSAKSLIALATRVIKKRIKK